MEFMEIGELVILALETMLVSSYEDYLSLYYSELVWTYAIEIYLHSSVGGSRSHHVPGNGGRSGTTIFVDCLHWHSRDFL